MLHTHRLINGPWRIAGTKLRMYLMRILKGVDIERFLFLIYYY